MDAFESFISTPGTLARPSLIVRCRVCDGKVDIKIIVERVKSQGRLQTQVAPLLNRIVRRIRGSIDVFLLISDTINVSLAHRSRFIDFLKHVPLLRCDWLEEDHVSCHSIIIPDYRVLDENYARDFDAVIRASAQIPFERRIETIKWRGRLSGPMYPDIHNCKDFPRYHLVVQAARHSDIIDARITNYSNVPDSKAGMGLRQRMDELLGGTVRELRPEEFVANRYVLAVDGVTAPWKTVPMMLATGSVLLMQHRWRQYFHPGLTAWVHYVPILDDFSDILERYEWLRKQPEMARDIAGNGQCFAREILKPAMIDSYFTDVVDQCGKFASV